MYMSKRSKLTAVTLALTMMIFAGLISFGFNQQIDRYIVETSDSRIEEVVTASVLAFEQKIEDQTNKVVMMADHFSYSDTLDNQDHIEQMNKAVKNNQLFKCTLVLANGDFVTNDNETGNVSQEAFFIAGMNDQIYLSNPMTIPEDDTQKFFSISAPITKNNEVIGVLAFSYLSSKEKPFFDMTFLNNEGQLMLINSDGNLLLGEPEHLSLTDDNITAKLSDSCSHLKHEPENCLKLDQDKAFYIMSGEKGNVLIHYNKLRFKDWYMMEVISEKSLLNATSMVEGEQFNLGITILLLFTLYIVIVGVLWYKDKTNYDQLTGAPSFDNLKKKAERMMKKNPKSKYVLVKLDVKGFKLINNIYNFEVGDQVIVNIVKALNQVLDEKKTAIARLGIDDFIIFMHYKDKGTLDGQRANFIKTFKQLMGESFTTNVEFPTGQYVVDLSETQTMNIGLMYERANFAHGLAKVRDSENIIDYETSIEKEAIFQKKIEDRMEDALENEEFQLFFQAKVDTKKEKMCGLEALVRWEVDGIRIMHPTDFIPVFEKNGFIVRVDMYMFKKAVIKIKELMDKQIKPVPVSVNFSRYHLFNKNFVRDLCLIADEYQVPHNMFEIELTESVAFDNEKRMLELIEELHKEKFKISLDDFGSGYSSIGLLKNLKVDTIKLDRSMFINAVDEERAWVVISNIIKLAKDLNCSQVAEGIEERYQVDKLKELECDMIQGFYFSRPVKADEIDYKDTVNREE